MAGSAEKRILAGGVVVYLRTVAIRVSVAARELAGSKNGKTHGGIRNR